MTWEYFKEDEFRCKCGCGGLIVDNKLVAMLDDARAAYKAPMVVVSGYRCAKRNAAVGGKRNSAHRKGMAADIRYTTARDLFRMLNIFFIVGFKRVGIGRGFVHVDTSTELPQEVAWLYND